MENIYSFINEVILKCGCKDNVTQVIADPTLVQ